MHTVNPEGVFYRGTLLGEADPATFLIINSFFSRDRKRFHSGSRILDLESGHTRVIRDAFARDREYRCFIRRGEVRRERLPYTDFSD